MKQPAICIAGAHRSGTSMLTRLLHSCGLYLGPEEDLMPAAADNLDGFWENLRFVRLNDEILNALGAAWDLPPRSESSFDSDILQPQRAKAHLLLNSFADHHKWGWKDPRNCLTLPFWRSLIPDFKTVIIIRNPLEVAYSMNRRNGTSYALGLRLWEIYNRRLLAHTTVQKRVITHYEAFFSDPQNEMLRIANFLGLNDASKIAAAVALVAVNRRHTAFTVEQMIDAGVAEPIVSLYRRLLEESDDTATREIQDKSLVESEGDPLSGTESRLQTSIPDSEGMRQELAQRRGAEIAHRQEVDRHQKTIEGLRQELALNSIRSAAEINRRDGRVEELQKAYAHLDKLLQDERTQRERLYAELERVRRETWDQLAAARQQLERGQKEAQDSIQERDTARRQTETVRQEIATAKEEAEAARQQSIRDGEEMVRNGEEIAQLRQRFAQTNQLLQDLSIRLADFESRNVSLTDRLRRQLIETKRLLRILDQIDEASGLLQKSRRWKLANPFASVVAAMSGKALPGFGYLDKNVAKYRVWRDKHPELSRLDQDIQDLRPREILAPLAVPEPPKATSQAEPVSTPKPPPPDSPVSFTLRERVEISIVIPVYNQVEFTHACLAAVKTNSGEIPYEVIIVDDASTDKTREVIGQIPGLTYLRVEENAGFIAACNRGAAAARGDYLVFLNNDTTVTTGWLGALRETFLSEPEAGLVGSKLVYPDGRLQEAGGIIWRDGSGWNRGKFQDAAKPEYNYLREVNYCSAASVMIPKSLFDRLGGFDLKYAPAYYEDTDLAFKVAASGRKVLYQPQSVVVHYEGITSGTDISSGAKKYQEVNRSTFIRSWAGTLASLPANGDIDSFNAPPQGKKRILVIDHHLPMPDRDSGSLRMFHLLLIFHQLGHQVTFLPDNLADIPPYGDALRKRGVMFHHHPYVKSIKDYLKKEGPKFDVIILSRCDFARKHMADARAYAPQSRVIFDTVDLHFLREERCAEITKDAEGSRKAEEKRQLEYELIEQADETWVVSPAEKDLLLSVHPDYTIKVVSNIVELPGSATPFANRRDILFIGSFQHPPNTDAILFFAEEIFPLVQKHLPEVRLYIIGDKAPPEVIGLTSERVIVTGYQPDVAVFFNTIKLSIAPLRYGAGVKGKVNQSMSYGVPVVATPVAAEGMSLVSDEEIAIAATPAAFAAKVIELYSSEVLWERISRKGLLKTQELFSIEAARRQLEEIIGSDQKSALSTAPLAKDSPQPVTA